MGNISKACAALSIGRCAHYEFLEKYEDYRQEFNYVQEDILDFVEQKLLQKINGILVQGKKDIYEIPPDTIACIFYLKTKGKHRGYIERTEQDNRTLIEISDKRITFK